MLIITISLLFLWYCKSFARISKTIHHINSQNPYPISDLTHLATCKIANFIESKPFLLKIIFVLMTISVNLSIIILLYSIFRTNTNSTFELLAPDSQKNIFDQLTSFFLLTFSSIKSYISFFFVQPPISSEKVVRMFLFVYMHKLLFNFLYQSPSPQGRSNVAIVSNAFLYWSKASRSETFFSGHTSLMLLSMLACPIKLRIIVYPLSIFTILMLIVFRIHYIIDIAGAFAFVFIAYKAI